jgi:hypothetical protein
MSMRTARVPRGNVSDVCICDFVEHAVRYSVLISVCVRACALVTFVCVSVSVCARALVRS